MTEKPKLETVVLEFYQYLKKCEDYLHEAAVAHAEGKVDDDSADLKLMVKALRCNMVEDIYVSKYLLRLIVDGHLIVDLDTFAEASQNDLRVGCVGASLSILASVVSVAEGLRGGLYPKTPNNGMTKNATDSLPIT